MQISEIFPGVAKHMDKLSIIRSMRTQERNHPQGTIETLCGHRPNPALKFPSLGSIVSKELGARDNMPPFVVVPLPTEGDFFNYEEAYRSGFLGPAYDSMILPDPSKPDFVVPDLSLPKSISAEAIDDRRTMLKIVDQHYRQKENTAEFAKMDTFQEQALRMILSPHVKEAFNISQESEKTRDRYGRTRVGQSVLLARRLVEAGCRFVTAAGYTHGQWDTHGENDKRLRDTLAPMLDQSLSALMEDLAQRGLLESTVVLVTGEFGRTPTINPNRGRDHWPDCWSLLVGGGGIEGGRVVGASDERGVAHAARVGRRPLVAVERPGQDAGARGLAAAARAGEQVGVVHLAVEDRLLQRTGHVLLADDLAERAGAVLAVQGEAHAGKRTSPVRPSSARISAAVDGTAGVRWKDPSRTRQSSPTLAAFRPWGSSGR